LVYNELFSVFPFYKGCIVCFAIKLWKEGLMSDEQ